MQAEEGNAPGSDPDVAVVGGGIAGLCSAIALRDAGYEVVVYEAADDVRATGAGLWIPPNGAAALAELGVVDAVASRGVALARTEIRSRDGTRLVATDAEAHADRLGYDHALLGIHRGDLLGVLAAHLPDAAVRCGRECEAVDPAGPTLSFTDGTTVSPSLVLGADGVGSAVRDTVAPRVDPAYAGAVAYRGLVDAAVPDEASDAGVVYWGRVGSVGYSAIGADRAWWFASIPAERPADVPDLSPTELRDRFEDFPAPVPSLLATTPPGDLIRTPLVALPELESWTRGPVAVVGDAAHAMPPTLSQGSAQAMEDAVALGRAVDCHGLAPVALENYESRRKDRADDLNRTSKVQGRIARVSNPLAVRARNLLFRLTPPFVARRQSEQLFTAAF